MTTGDSGAPDAAYGDAGRVVPVVLRGNSAQGKTTTATAIQHSPAFRTTG
ncbi:hypothetical protein [Nocardia acidivorans]|nr:hypothetical protein [Nocardia acidivorans]